MLGELLIRWTIWLSMLAYALYLLCLCQPRRFDWSFRRGIWTFSMVTFVGHFLSAYHFYHHWSHAHVVADTATKTENVIGWSFGQGIYFSYLFLGVWLLDVLWMWGSPSSYQSRSRGIGWMIHIYLFFIAINGTAVFESGVTRWATIVCCVVLVLVLAARARHIREA